MLLIPERRWDRVCTHFRDTVYILFIFIQAKVSEVVRVIGLFVDVAYILTNGSLSVHAI